MDEDRTLTLSAECYERLQGLAAARGRTVEEQVAVLVEDACAGGPPDQPGLPLGVCDDDGRRVGRGFDGATDADDASADAPDDVDDA